MVIAGLLDGLLLPAAVAGPSSALQRSQGDVEPQHKNVGGHLETGHVLLQREKILRPHHHSAQQTAAHQTRRQHPLLRQVMQIPSAPSNFHQFSFINYFHYSIPLDSIGFNWLWARPIGQLTAPN